MSNWVQNHSSCDPMQTYVGSRYLANLLKRLFLDAHIHITTFAWPYTKDIYNFRWPVKRSWHVSMTGFCVWFVVDYGVHCPLISSAAAACRRSERRKRHTCPKEIIDDSLMFHLIRRHLIKYFTYKNIILKVYFDMLYVFWNAHL